MRDEMPDQVRHEGLKPAMRRAGMKGDVYYETNV